jgi:glycine dehydrogenase
MKININNREAFEGRHIGPNNDQLSKMLSTIGVANLDQLIDETVPETIRLKKPLDLPKAKSEFNFLKDFKQLAKKK